MSSRSLWRRSRQAAKKSWPTRFRATSSRACRLSPASISARPAAEALSPGAVAMKTTQPLTPWRTFSVAAIAIFLVSIDATVLYATFPALRRAFPDVGAPGLSWVLNAYSVVYAALLAPAGRLADLYGRKRMFVVGVGIFLLASLGCGLSAHIALLIGARVLQAIGAALLLPASLSIVLAAFPRE